MIDSHVHTRYSKHATGSVDEVLRSALARGIGVITFTDHAPFIVDTDNRLLERELESYFEEIEQARTRYAGEIEILTGLEVDYMLGASGHAQKLLAGLDLDFVIGSIHYLPVAGGRVNVWDLPRLNEPEALACFFRSLEESVSCGLFDAIGHPDSLLRAVAEDAWCARFQKLLPLLARHQVSYELNASGLRKSTYDSATGKEAGPGSRSYPSRSLLPQLVAQGVSFTAGSDAHDPRDVGVGVRELLQELAQLGLREISYYRRRQRIGVPLGALGVVGAPAGNRP